ncbi:MAG: hypothetical protein AUI10_10555 [Actinobacteria bacterium 13_2_20CM_2_72_6]|nr:MAG: hypothetical protein AUI10_10555 [Actinobacteria bacterium 13_2_20CM_2_72_6]
MRTAVWLYRRSGGKIGGKMGQAPVALLTTTGRKSGRSWTNPVLYQPEGNGWVIIAWKMTAVYPTYDEYQKKTTRRIPVVYLTRR